jgi:gas vesicle protein
LPSERCRQALEEVETVRKVMSFLAGFFVGGLVGGAAGLLLAPSGGTELQERIRGRFEDLAEEGRRAASARQAELEAQLEAFKSGEAVTIEAKQESP